MNKLAINMNEILERQQTYDKIKLILKEFQENKKDIKIKDDKEEQKNKVSSFFKKTGVKSRIFKVDDDNLPIITEKNVEFL